MTERVSRGLLPVLLVDDENEILKSLARDLRRNAQIESFTDPTAALEAFKSKAFGVVISDLKMPKMNGLQLLEQCAILRPECQRILVTAYMDLANLPDSINRSRLNFIMTKPWEPDDLRAIVEQAQRQNELERENIELRRMALTDALTGIANNRYFWERLDSEFARAHRYGRPLSLIMGDVDNFKSYNDTYGHQHGDEVLRQCAQAMEGGKRSADTVARYGGEEFTIILPEVARPLAIEIANRHLQLVKEKSGIGMSFGVASFPDDAGSTTELVDKADRALLKAKSSGKGRVLSALDL
jgi:diguanylate cyclase (GGDEF)-like protein